MNDIDSKFNLRFLLAPLHINSLSQEPTVGHIKRALQNLPKKLNETYEQAMIRIESQGQGFQELAKKILSWLIHSKRILSTSELRHAVGIEPGKSELDGEFIPDIEIIGSICAGLVTIDTQSDVFRLVHYTTQEYLERTSEDWFPKAETYIAMTCVTYLSFNVFESGICRTDGEFEKRLQIYPLYGYAVRNWGHHARTASLEIEQLILDFLWNEAKVSASSQALIALRISWRNSGYSQEVPRRMIGVHLAAYFGLIGVIMALLRNRDNPFVEDGWGRTPLIWAARNGHEAVVKLLLEKGAQMDSKDKYNQTALLLAVQNGHEAMVKMLLKEGADLDSKDVYGQTPLSRAARKGHEAVIGLLLDKGAELDSKDNRGRTPLFWAVEYRHEAMVKLLLRKGAELESKDAGFGWTPLSRAAEHGHEGVVKLLIEKGAEVESKDVSGQTPLSQAAKNGHKAVVKLLLGQGAEMDSKDAMGQTPLSLAARGHEVVVKMMVDKGADLEANNNFGRTPL